MCPSAALFFSSNSKMRPLMWDSFWCKYSQALLFPVTWVPLQRKSTHVKKKSVLPSCYHSQAQSYLPELFIFLDYLFFQHLKQKMLAPSLREKKSPALLGTKVASHYTQIKRQTNFSLKTPDLLLLWSLNNLWAISRREFMASRTWKPAWVHQSLPCVLEFLAEHCSSQLLVYEPLAGTAPTRACRMRYSA